MPIPAGTNFIPFFPCKDNDPDELLEGQIGIVNRGTATKPITEMWYRPIRENSTDPAVDPVKLESLKNNYSASVAPTISDDGDAGYSVGSVWIDAPDIYVCTDDTAGAATWVAAAGVSTDGETVTGNGTASDPIASADTFKLTATTETTGATSDSADMLLSDGSYLTVEDNAITAFEFSILVAVKSSSDAGFFGSRKFTGEFQTGSVGSVFGTLTYDDGEYAPSGHTVTNPAISIDGSGNLIISCEHESTRSGDCVVEWSATLKRIEISSAKIGS